MQTATSISTGTFMNRGASCGVLGRSRGSPLKNTSWTKRAEYATLNAPPSATAAGASRAEAARDAAARAPRRRTSPSRGSRSATAPRPSPRRRRSRASPVYGMYFQSPFMRRMSRVPALVLDDPGRHEQRRLEGRVVADVEHRGHVRERRVEADQERDQAEMAHRRVGEQPLEVVLEHGHVRAERRTSRARRWRPRT